MSEDVDELVSAVQARCGGKATLVDSTSVSLTLADGRLWTGVVREFQLLDLFHGRRAFAWRNERQVHVVFQLPTIPTPADAVRRTLEAERLDRARKGPREARP